MIGVIGDIQVAVVEVTVTAVEDDEVDSDGEVVVVAVHPGIDTAGFLTVAAGVSGIHPEAVALTGEEISHVQSGKPHVQKMF